MKTCNSCFTEKPISEFNQARGNRDGLTNQCKSCVHVRWKEWYEKKNNQKGETARERNARRNREYYASDLGQQRAFERRLARYKLSKQEFQVLWEQSKGLCEICNTAPATTIDHCHKTGAVRGLLCAQHNLALGGFSDSPELLSKALEYLNK